MKDSLWLALVVVKTLSTSIIRVITNSDDCAVGVRFVYHEYRLQTELDDTKYYNQLIIKITISEKRKIAKLCDNGKIYIKKLTKDALIV